LVSAAAKTKRVSVHSNGDEADDGSYNPSISRDGRNVAFASSATNLVKNDTNGSSDVFQQRVVERRNSRQRGRR
jgi:Tol biopolymer transport system component